MVSQRVVLLVAVLVDWTAFSVADHSVLNLADWWDAKPAAHLSVHWVDWLVVQLAVYSVAAQVGQKVDHWDDPQAASKAGCLVEWTVHVTACA